MGKGPYVLTHAGPFQRVRIPVCSEVVPDLEVSCDTLTLLAKVSRSAKHEREAGTGCGLKVHARFGDGRVPFQIARGHIIAVDGAAAFAVELAFPGAAQVPAEGLILLKFRRAPVRTRLE